MNLPEDLLEQSRRVLGRLTELGLMIAEDFAACAVAATDPEEKTRYALSFERTARATRHNLALRLKFECEHLRLDKDAREQATRDTKAQVDHRKARLKSDLERLIWTEAEAKEAEALESELEDLLEAETLRDDFLDVPLEEIVARLCKALDLSLPAAEAQQPPSLPPPDNTPWRSSA